MTVHSNPARGAQGANRLFAPLEPLLRRLTLGSKFALIAAVLFIPLAFMLMKDMMRVHNDLTFTQGEIVGASLITNVNDLVLAMQRHRGQTAVVLAGDANARSSRDESRQEAHKQIATITSEYVGHPELGMAAEWEPVRAELQKVLDDTSADAAKSFAAHTAVIQKLIDTNLLVAEKSGLSLEPDGNAYYLMSIAVEHMSHYGEATAQMRGLTSKAMARKEWTLEDSSKFSAAKREMEQVAHTIQLRNAALVRTGEAVPKGLSEAMEAQAVYVADIGSWAKIGPLRGDAEDVFRKGSEVVKLIHEANDRVVDRLTTLLLEREARLKASRLASICLGVGGVLLSLYMFFAVSRSMRAASEVVTQAAQGLAQGQLDLSTAVEGKDEFAQIARSVQAVQQTVQSLISEINHMSTAHEAGDIDVVIDNAKFQGDYRTMAQGANDMVASQIAVTRKAMDCFKAFGEGDFNAAMESLPGKKAFINTTIEQVRHNLKALIEDASMLAGAAVAGQLDTRADAARHQGDFRLIVKGMNDTLDAIVTPLKGVQETLARMEGGNLSRGMDGRYQGAFAELQQALDNTMLKLSSTLSDVSSAAGALTAAAGQVSSTSQSLSQSASEQAASVEETTASLQEMAASVKQNSDNANVTDGMASKAAKEALEGGSAVSRTVEAMKQIATKISIIDDIAYQTNLLALNAAIEAARAGEHGKGFAVVAAEVRKLAERSQVAAQEIGELAGSSVGLAEQAGTVLTQMVPTINKTSELVQEISAASGEQAQGVNQITTAMGHLNSATQQNASASEELSATAEELSSQAAQLQEMMAFFQLSEGERPAATARQRAPRAPALDSSAARSRLNGASGVSWSRSGHTVDEASFGRF